MILTIDTTKNNQVEIALRGEKGIVARKKFAAKRSQAEKLLPEIDKILKENKLRLSAITEIQVANLGLAETSFTALRIGVVTANALGYALGIPVQGFDKREKQKNNLPFDIVTPVYRKKPNIS